MEVAVQEEISEELSQETWLSEVKIEEAIEETVEESNGILETLQKAVEEHRADVKDAIKEANVPLPSCSRGEASALADVMDARLVDLRGAQSSAALAAPVSVGFGLEATTEAIPADLVAGEETIGLHGIPPAQAAPETDAGLTVAQHEHVTTAGVQQAVNHIEPTLDPEWLTALYCNLHEDGKERQAPALPTSPTPESLGHGLGQGSMTPAHQALHAARQYMQIPHTDAELCQFVRTLAIELGASRKEAGTGGNKVAPSPNEVPAVACCKLLHDPKGNTAFVCRYPGCEKSYASRDAVRKHCRIHHLQWLRTLERVTTHEEEMVEVTLPVRTLKVQAVYEQRRDVLAVLVSLLASRDE